MEDLQPQFRDYIRRHGLLAAGEMIVVGVSGGPDSLCLLHLLRRLAPELALRLHVAHLNHGLRGPEADEDAEFVAELAACWGLPVTIGRADVAALAAQPGRSLEEAARLVRYAFLAEVADATGATTIAVGHNADDQAETVLMHFLRGSGVAGLRGMLPRAPLSDYRLGEPAAPRIPASPRLLVRPLLAIPRADIEAYCAAHSLAPRFDRSNEDTTFYRNRLRHELLPLLATYNPAIGETLARTAAVLAGDHEIVQAALDAAWAAAARPAPDGASTWPAGGGCPSACSARPCARRCIGCATACGTSVGSTSSAGCGWGARAGLARQQPWPRAWRWRSATMCCASRTRAQPGRPTRRK